jgi:hypothetical protein
MGYSPERERLVAQSLPMSWLRTSYATLGNWSDLGATSHMSRSVPLACLGCPISPKAVSGQLQGRRGGGIYLSFVRVDDDMAEGDGRLPHNARVTGWHDNARLSYVEPGPGPDG